MEFNYLGFKKLCQAPHFELLEWIKSQLCEMYGNNMIHTPRWVYFQGTSPVCLVAHLDTVHKETLTDMYVETEKGIITSPQGIGGDDRCGVWIILKVLASLSDDGDLPSLFFSTDEETGSASTKDACDALIKDFSDCMDNVRFFIQLDRHNKDDSVYYNCDNKDFEKYINSYGFKTAIGSRTDICILCDRWDKAGVNLSCGFEGEHKTTEYVDIGVMLATTEKVIKIVEEAKDDVVFKFNPKTRQYNSGVGNGYSGVYGGAYDYLND